MTRPEGTGYTSGLHPIPFQMRRLTLLTAAALAPSVLAAQAIQKDAPAASAERAPLPDPTLPLKRAPEPTAAAISPKDLMSRLYQFADDSMMGRDAGTAGNVKGTDYIAREVQRLGLKPAGENGTYFQTIPMKTRGVDPTSKVSVGGAALALGTEWAAAGLGALTGTDVPVVFAGAINDTTSFASAEQVQGKLAVILVPPGASMRPSARVQAAARAAAGVALVVPDQFLNLVRRPQPFLDDQQAAPTAPNAKPTLYITQGAGMKLFPGVSAIPAPGTTGAPVTLDVRIAAIPVEHPARNVVAIVEGRDPALKNQYVAIGAHNDHVGFGTRPVDHDSMRIFLHVVRPGGAEDSGKQPTPDQQAEINRLLAAYRAKNPNSARLDSIYNGADDDGSGSMAVLEIAEQMASLKGNARPKRSILFVWHVAEEKGLWGAEYFTDHPTVPRDSIVAQLNVDMIGRGNAWDETGKTKEGAAIRGNEDYLQLIGSRRLSTQLGDIVEDVNKTGKFNFKFDYSLDANGHPMNIYCRSDHYEYARYGIPIVFFTTGGHSDYHQVTDEPRYIDYDHLARGARLIDAIATRVANLDQRIVVDQPKPDPKGTCRQ
jgi:hypothetical protein